MTLIHKGETKFKPANYRPVSLTSHVMNIFENTINMVLSLEGADKHNYYNITAMCRRAYQKVSE